MYKALFTLSLSLIGNIIFGQAVGNFIYLNQKHSDRLVAEFNSPNEIIIEVRGLCNLKADAYLAIFTITQIGKTAEEATELMDKRTNAVHNELRSHSDVSIYTDMISFVPMYEYQAEKKIFSKTTYNEIPAGFELKKNLHVQFKNPEFINKLVTICAKSEIYDLAKVEYISTELEKQKEALIKQAQAKLEQKIERYSKMVNMNLDSLKRRFTEDFLVYYPADCYHSYQAYFNTSLKLKKSQRVSGANKSTSLYYQPIQDRDYDFVISPSIIEPVIQVAYETKLMFILPPVKEKEVSQSKDIKEYYLVTPNGDVKKLPN